MIRIHTLFTCAALALFGCDDGASDAAAGDGGPLADGGAGGSGGAGGVTECTRAELNAIRDADAWAAAFAQCETLEGDLTYRSQGPLTQGIPPEVTVLEAPNLTRIDGEISLNWPTLQAVRLPALTTLDDQGAEVDLDGCDALTEVLLPALTQAPRLILKDLPALAQLDLAALGQVTVFELSETGLPRLTLPALVTAEVLVVNANPGLERLDAPALTTVARTAGRGRVEARLSVTGNDQLATLELPALARAEDGLWIAGNPALTALDFPALTQHATAYDGPTLLIGVAGNDALTRLDLSALSEITDPGAETRGQPLDWSISSNPALTDLRLPAAQPFPHTLKLQGLGVTELVLPFTRIGGSLEVRNMAGLTRLAAPDLAVIDYVLFVTGNPVLAELDLPALTEARSHDVSDNPALPQAAIDALDAQLGE